MKNQALSIKPSLLRRLSAIFYDSWLILGLYFLTGVLLIAVRVLLQGPPTEGEHALGGGWQLPTFICMVLVTLFFFAFFWVKNKQTLAMQAWRIELRDEATGGNITWQQALIRFSAAFVSAACFGLGYLWMLIDKEDKTWHDHASGSYLVLLPKQKK